MSSRLQNKFIGVTPKIKTSYEKNSQDLKCGYLLKLSGSSYIAISS